MAASNGALSYSAMMVANPNRFNNKVNTDLVLDHYRKHSRDLERAYRIVCSGVRIKNAIMKKKVVGTMVYILLRMGFDEEPIKQFMTIANSGNTIEGVECSPALVIRRMIQEDRKSAATASSSAEETLIFLGCLVKAYADFTRGIRRVQNYSESKDRGLTFLNDGKALDDIEVDIQQKEA